MLEITLVNSFYLRSIYEFKWGESLCCRYMKPVFPSRYFASGVCLRTGVSNIVQLTFV